MLKKIYSNIGGSLIFRSFGIIFTLLLNFIVAKLCGSYGYGIFYQGLAVFSIITIVGCFGLENLLLIKTSEYVSKHKITKISALLLSSYRFMLPIMLFIVLFLYLSSDWLALNFYKDENMAISLKYYSLGFIPFILLQYNSESLKGLSKIKIASFLQGFAPNFLALLIGFIFYMFILKEASSFILGYILAFWFIFIFSAYTINRYLKINFDSLKENFSIKRKKLFKSSKTFWTISSVSIISTNVIAVILGYFLDAKDVGIYGVATKISLIVSFILPSINSAMAPEFVSNIIKKDFITLGKLAKKSSFIMSFVSIPLVLFLTFFSNQVMGVFGDEFKSGGILLIILVWGQFFNAITGSVGYILMSARLEKFLLYSLLFSLIISLILSVVLIPLYGTIGASIAIAISVAFQNLYSSYICYSKLSVVPLFFIKNSALNEQ